MNHMFGRQALSPWNRGPVMGMVGEYFDVPNGAFPVPWGGSDCQDPEGCGESSLGQAAMTPGAGFMGPFGMYSDIGTPPRGNAPTGFPRYTEQIAQPGGEKTEMHCYRCPDGVYRSLTIPQARSMGCDAVDSSYCGGAGISTYAKGAPYGLMGRMGQGGSPMPMPPPPPGPMPHPRPHLRPRFERVFFSPRFPVQYAYPPPPPTNRMICRKLDQKDEEGNELFECQTQPAPYTYPVNFLFRPMGW